MHVPKSEELLAAIEKIKNFPSEVDKSVADHCNDPKLRAAIRQLADQKANHVLILLRQLLEVAELYHEQEGTDS